MYSSDSYPLDWTKSNVLFIKKSYGKNVRPISLTSCVCKLFETILKNKFQWWLEFNNLPPPNQSGFRKSQSTTDNLTGLTLTVAESFAKKKDILAAFLDVTGAFDNVDINILLQQLGAPHIELNLLNLSLFKNEYSPINLAKLSGTLIKDYLKVV